MSWCFDRMKESQFRDVSKVVHCSWASLWAAAEEVCDFIVDIASHLNWSDIPGWRRGCFGWIRMHKGKEGWLEMRDEVEWRARNKGWASEPRWYEGRWAEPTEGWKNYGGERWWRGGDEWGNRARARASLQATAVRVWHATWRQGQLRHRFPRASPQPLQPPCISCSNCTCRHKVPLRMFSSYPYTTLITLACIVPLQPVATVSSRLQSLPLSLATPQCIFNRPSDHVVNPHMSSDLLPILVPVQFLLHSSPRAGKYNFTCICIYSSRAWRQKKGKTQFRDMRLQLAWALFCLEIAESPMRRLACPQEGQ